MILAPVLYPGGGTFSPTASPCPGLSDQHTNYKPPFSEYSFSTSCLGDSE